MFEPGPARRSLGQLVGSEIIAGGDATIPKLLAESDELAPDTGIDFLYSDRDGLRVAVEVKLIRTQPERAVRDRAQLQIHRFLERNKNTADRAEVWIVSKGGSQLTIWQGEERQDYGLASIVSTDDRVAFDLARRKPIDSEYVEGRALAWIRLVKCLFTELSEWCESEGYNADQSSSTTMNEDLMQRFGVSPLSVPILKIYQTGVAVASVLPIGLWVIGASGRLDLLMSRSSASIVNVSYDPEIADWLIYIGKLSSHLTKESFLKVIAQE